MATFYKEDLDEKVTQESSFSMHCIVSFALSNNGTRLSRYGRDQLACSY